MPKSESLIAAEIRWPERYAPASAEVFVRNEITIAALPETIWAWLIRAESWPEWYKNADHIHFLSTAGPNLRDRSRIRWNTFGARITSKVLEFEPYARLGWDAHGIGIEAYPAWVLTPLGDGTTHVLTEEAQHGWRARIGNRLMPRRLSRMHQLWLEGLCAKAEGGLPKK
jgi:uncharacterized protein YndB with AHSA1/START domain